MRRHTGIIVLAAALPLVACGRSNRSQDTAAARAMAAVGDSIVASGNPFIIHSKNDAVDLGLRDDTVYMALSDSVRAKAQVDMDTGTAGESSGFGHALSNVIKKTVNRALSTRIAYAVSELDGASYEDGAITFDYKHKHRLSFESVKTDDDKALASFAPADAQRFVAAVNAAIRAQ